MQRVLMLGLGLMFITIIGLNFSAYSANQAPKLDTVAVQKDMPASKQLETIVIGAGCFWGAEKRYEAIPGVLDAVSGYADGNGIEPTYEAITRPQHKLDPNNFAEVVQVTFNPTMVSLEAILQNYFEGHDPTQLNRQGNDVGTQYRSTILIQDLEQQQTAEQVKVQFQQLLSAAGYGQIATVIKPLSKFYPAEKHHQDYLAKNPDGYCPDHSTSVKFASAKTESPIDNSPLSQGKQIVVIESDSYCPYCEKFKKDVTSSYQGDIKIHSRLASQLDGLTIKTATWATPTILFLENGSEVFGRQGYLSSDEFYHALGLWKLGKSEAYNVAFDEGTDGRFCKQYEIFKNTPDGVFVDKLSGAPLFDTKDRFNSGTGWLSFTKTVNDAVIEREDNRYGMQRIEILSKSSGIHLGHVFPDGPNGMPRYCINATVLDFVPRTNPGR